MTRGMIALALLLGGCATTAPPYPPARVQAILPGSYSTANPFARILRGELPVAKVYEDADVLAFMDNHPEQTGHVLVISKRSHARNLLEMPPATLDRLLAVARRVGEAQMTGLGATGFTVVQNNGSAQTVFHLHIHVIPRYPASVEAAHTHGGAEEPVSALEPVAARIRAALKPH